MITRLFLIAFGLFMTACGASAPSSPSASSCPTITTQCSIGASPDSPSVEQISISVGGSQQCKLTGAESTTGQFTIRNPKPGFVWKAGDAWNGQLYVLTPSSGSADSAGPFTLTFHVLPAGFPPGAVWVQSLAFGPIWVIDPNGIIVASCGAQMWDQSGS
jgi:hypothetical protein